MAVLTDILIAPEHDVPAIMAEWPGAKKWLALETTGLDGLMLTELAEAFDQPVLARAIEDLAPSAAADEAAGPWVYVLPIDFRDRVAGISKPDLGTIAKSWAEREEASLMGLTPEIAEGLLRDLQNLATEAQAREEPLLLWVSL